MSDHVDHPYIPGWRGERGWSAPDEPPSDFVDYEADDEGAPFRMAHGRDMMFRGAAIEQDYNFIDYWFGDPAAPVVARYYMMDRHVSVRLPTLAGGGTLPQARKAFPVETLSYLQKRFDAIHVLTRNGYEGLWSAGDMP